MHRLSDRRRLAARGRKVQIEGQDLEPSTLTSHLVEYLNLSAAQLQRAARRAARAWSLQPGPMWTFVKELRNCETLGQLVRIGGRHLSWTGIRYRLPVDVTLLPPTVLAVGCLSTWLGRKLIG